MLALVAAYKVGLSPILGGACRFLPSCSDYMAEAVRRHGAARGVALGLARLGRCHPFCTGGHDPVPHGLPSWLGGAPGISGGPSGARPR